MKNKILLKTLWGILALLFSANGLLAQEIPIQGKITSSDDNMPLPGVTVIVKGTTNGTTSDFDGNYSINVSSPNSILVFSSIGFISKEIKVDGQKSINVSLKTDITALDEVIVVGYDSKKVKDLTGAIETVKVDDIKDLPGGNAMKNLQGRLAGVQVYTNGNPASGAVVRIRGEGLGRLGNNDPLYVIDGVPTKAGMHELNQNDIESIQVLKDAAAASIYGSRAANGVIIITTKKGSNKLSVSIKSSVSIEDFQYDVRPLNTEERATVVWRAAVNDGINPNTVSPLYNYQWNGDFSNPELNKILFPEYIDGAREMRPANTNWFDQITQTSVIQDHNVAVSNGNESGNYYMSLGYYDHDGIIKYSNFERYTFKLNSTYDVIKDVLTIGENFTGTNQSANKVNDQAEYAAGIAFEQQSIVPIRTEDGSDWGGPTGGITNTDNPVRVIEDSKHSKYHFNRFLGNVFVEFKPISNLKLRSSFGVDYNIFYWRDFKKAYSPGNLNVEDQLVNAFSRYGNYVWSNIATYNIEKGNHNIALLAGSESISYQSEEFSASRRGFAAQNLDFAYLNQGTENIQNGGSGTKWTLQSFFAKADYNLKDKYLASATIRRDGSSRFGANNRWGNFPAASVGWRISNENFLKDSKGLSELKLRGSWGLTGNQEIDPRAQYVIFEPRYATQSMFTFNQDNGTAYDINGNNSGQLPSGFAKAQTGNPDLKWETSETINFGVDFGLFDDKLTGSIEYYVKETKDILTSTQPVATEGEGANRFVNAGTVENRGLEVVLGYADSFNIGNKALDININGNIATLSNKVKELPLHVQNQFGGNGDDQTIIGRNVYSVYGYVADGLFQSQEEVDAHAAQSGAAPGRIRFKDLNEDGVVDDLDQKFFTSTSPKILYGLNIDMACGAFDFNMFFQGVYGSQAVNWWKLFTDFTSINAGSNYGERTLNAWTPENTDTDVPALTTVDNNNEWRVSTFRYENSSYLKFRNLSVGYTLPENIISKLGISKARIFLSGQNMFTIKARSTRMQDPETPGAGFPIPRRYSLGLNFTF
ncbi:Vitamin B12 transporter BtuB [Mariniflexile rhizosphaerae]|uniref:SusC/RagA family TonB-linked outer membrane protein n=1 Tax=unclassified Mariniflexile TaxID=2643887 RepID=UPI000E3312D1|nr:TonB-dependent receptor [Mariniflexile sp. TRM1-10]AXP81660.1 Vitamin B12 transporter BtuB [Mariniflexile sp. TRM1-10]